jgi:hypothetical protein
MAIVNRSFDIAAQQARASNQAFQIVGASPSSEIESVALGAKTVEIVLADAAVSSDQDRRIVLPWAPESTRRKREIVLSADPNDPRPHRAMHRQRLSTKCAAPPPKIAEFALGDGDAHL